MDAEKLKKTELEDQLPLSRPALPDRVNVLRVPVDIVMPEQLSGIIHQLQSSSGSKDIVLLSLWDLLRARRNKEYHSFVINAGLVIPISKSIISGARFLTGKIPYRYMPFNFVIGLLGILEHKENTAYLLGARKTSLSKTEKNLRRTFPQLRIVGRYPGYFRKQEEKVILEAIYKASPHLLLVGKGVRGGEMWIARNTAYLGNGLRLWCSDLFDIFAEKKKRPSEKAFEHGLESLGYCMKNPLKFLRIFPYIRYKFLLLIYKIFRII